jgi:GntR family transcriptional repressor for pyruvate dehydrogenase complex
MTNLQLSTVTPGRRLSEQVAEQLEAEVRSGRLAPGSKLPPEARLVEQLGVSRTVVREAVSRLKSMGLVDARQGSGVYVKTSLPQEPLSFNVRYRKSKEAVIQMVEVRRALEAEVAALAAQRRTAAELQRIRRAVAALDKAVKAGGSGVEQDVLFHRALAEAARNPFLMSTLDYLARFLHGTVGVMRANEAHRDDFVREVRDEHAAILAAIEAGDPAKARQSATRHMNNAVRRINAADPAFWTQEGERLAQPLVDGLPAADR